MFYIYTLLLFVRYIISALYSLITFFIDINFFLSMGVTRVYWKQVIIKLCLNLECSNAYIIVNYINFRR